MFVPPNSRRAPPPPLLSTPGAAGHLLLLNERCLCSSLRQVLSSAERARSWPRQVTCLLLHFVSLPSSNRRSGSESLNSLSSQSRRGIPPRITLSSRSRNVDTIAKQPQVAARHCSRQLSTASVDRYIYRPRRFETAAPPRFRRGVSDEKTWPGTRQHHIRLVLPAPRAVRPGAAALAVVDWPQHCSRPQHGQVTVEVPIRAESAQRPWRDRHSRANDRDSHTWRQHQHDLAAGGAVLLSALSGQIRAAAAKAAGASDLD